jgi:tetratricopeptide (TPR) repeat protein
LIAAAAREFALGHLNAAAAYTANALVRRPALPEAHELIARLSAHPDGGLQLFPLDDPLALADVLGHAHVAAAKRQFDKGLLLLGKAQAFAPETPWADVPWVTNPATAAAASPQVVTNLAVDLLSIVRDLDEAKRLPVASPYLQLVRNAVDAHPDHAPLHASAGFLYRRFDAAEAARYAERSEELNPGSAAAVALALIYRDQGRTDDAVQAIERAVERDSRNPERYADACDLLLRAGRTAEARGYALRGLDIDPRHACCEVSAAAAEFCQTRRSEHFDRLIRLTQSHPVGSHAYNHAAEVMRLVAEATSSRTVTLQGSPRQIKRQLKRELRNQRKS